MHAFQLVDDIETVKFSDGPEVWCNTSTGHVIIDRKRRPGPAPLGARPGPARLFQLHRDHDVSDVSGTGVIAEGGTFTDGTSVLRWLTDKPSVAVYESPEELIEIHGHNGATRLVWLDELTQEAA